MDTIIITSENEFFNIRNVLFSNDILWIESFDSIKDLLEKRDYARKITDHYEIVEDTINNTFKYKINDKCFVSKGYIVVKSK